MDKAQVDGQAHSNGLRAGLETRADLVIASVAKGGYSKTGWKILTREVDVLSDMVKRMFKEDLEHSSWIEVQGNEDNWIGNLVHKLWLLKRDNLELGKDLPLQYQTEDAWQQQRHQCRETVGEMNKLHGQQETTRYHRQCYG